MQKLAEMDTLSMFSKPVNTTEVVGYSEVIKCPMDLSTITMKLEQGEYRSDGDLEDDVVLMISNALKFNPKGSTFYALGDSFRRSYHEMALTAGLAVDSDAAYIPSKRCRDDDESTLLKAEQKRVENIDEVIRGLKEDQGVSLDELRQKYQRGRVELKEKEDPRGYSESTDESFDSDESAESCSSTSSDGTQESDESEDSSEDAATDSNEESEDTQESGDNDLTNE